MNYETALEAETEGQAIATEGQAIAEEPSSGGPDDGADARRRRLIRIGGAVLGAILLLALLFHFFGGEATDDKASQLPVVSVIVPGTTSIAGMIEATGTLAARREMPVGAVGEGGRVVSVPVDAGQWVRQGQILAVIDRSVQSQQVASAAAQVDVARADSQLAQANLDRALMLIDRGFIAKADVDRLTAARDAAVARVRVAQAQLGELRARTARLDITAPASGLLLTRNVEPGEVVSGGSGVLFSIARDGELELLAKLSEEDLARISPGVAAQVVPVGSDTSFTGQVWQVSPTIDAQTRQGTARIALAHAPGLRPGGFASATIRSGTLVAPLLPESAILSDEKGTYVLVVGKNNAVTRRAVKTGLVTADGITIASGLSGKETIVLRAGGFLAPGDRIAPRLVKRSAG